MDGQSRILVASPLGRVVAPILLRAFPGATVRVAVDAASVHREIVDKVRFDVVIADLVWNDRALEFRFDGLDVLDILRKADRQAPVIFARQGHSLEQDHVDEAFIHREVAYVCLKSSGTDGLPALIRSAAIGKRQASELPAPQKLPLYELFRGRRGDTAGRLAGAIAAGRCSDAATLAAAAGVALNTANKVAAHYLGPIIARRGEHDPDLPITLASVYRWCGIHSRYILSWCRRNGHAAVVANPAV